MVIKSYTCGVCGGRMPATKGWESIQDMPGFFNRLKVVSILVECTVCNSLYLVVQIESRDHSIFPCCQRLLPESFKPQGHRK